MFARYLRQLHDVLAREPADGDTLVYDAAQGKWQAGTGNGGSNPFTLFGPFRVNYNDPGIGTDDVILGPVPAGVFLIRTWVVIVSEWTDEGPSAPSFFVGITAPHVTLASYDTVSASVSDVGAEPEINDPLDYVEHRVALTEAASNFRVQAYPSSGSLLGGSLDVYALGYTPT